ncbi:TetR/AcrR family transcriptional regulator [Allokutzneria sp. A3M-2-11 16]|uniref:TetR/AcrR family transcriptional regulator n=1 Tax=Allokutzneria sp. A3M-2-11 16 TaxID=2962043 RepID=UPI0020B6BCBA|nr:TetR family transcriptional regulator [Allokutzneria sp. A3M-2-11 16]MCP3803494.1 TetR/AcrR family transcriptional regulator [Allokutzneria sp. A3M-2-11 16]
MTSAPEGTSARYVELLEAAYRYVLDRGISELSLRPLATAIGSSPRVLLYLFDSKDGLVRALLARAREDELALLRSEAHGTLAEAARHVWSWLASAEHAPLLRLWLEAYSRSVIDPDGPWGEFARSTVEDWLAVLAAAQPPAVRRTARGSAERTLALAVLRGALIDLLATGDAKRITASVHRYFA